MTLSKYNKIFQLLAFIYLSNTVSAQIITDSGNLFNEVSDFIANIPGSSGNEYSNPDNLQLDTWNNVISNLLNHNYTNAVANANSLGYDLIEFSDTTTTPDHIYYILKPNSSNHWGYYVFNPNYCRPLIIQSPHPKNDFNTGKQGIYVFKKTNALFYLLSGTHRCNSSQFSSCDGSTSVCTASNENYRISDLAHNDSTIFQKTTQILLNNYNDTYFIQLHGFAKRSTDPYVILSNGTRITPTLDYIYTFKNNLYNEDTSLTFKIAHIDLSWTRLIGFTNTQGRLINRDIDVCNSNATNTNGRFIHIEQEKYKLRNTSVGWDKVANALNNTFSCVPLSIANELDNTLINIYPNPTTMELTIEGDIDIKIKEIKVYNLVGQNLTKSVQIIKESSNKIYLNLAKLSTGSYILKTSTIAFIIYKK